jgi:solute carrier family 45, member 1/2/4
LAVVVSISLAFSIAITCVFVTEEKYRPPGGKIFDEKLSLDSFFSMTELVGNLLESVPKKVMYIYIIQLMAWMGWYPYLLYASTYMADICKS